MRRRIIAGARVECRCAQSVSAAQEFVRAIDQAGKPLAFICHAPWLLISAKLVEGRNLTSYHTIQDDIRNAGAHGLTRKLSATATG